MEDKDSSGERVQNVVARSRIAPDLLAQMNPQTDATPATVGVRSRGLRPRVPAQAIQAKPVPVIVELNDRFPLGSQAARAALLALYFDFKASRPADFGESAGIEMPRLPDSKKLEPKPTSIFAAGDLIDVGKSLFTTAYIFGQLSPATIDRLSQVTVISSQGPQALVYKVWSEHVVQRCVFQSAKTIKADAARAAFAAAGEGIVWAVADTGIDGAHPHFNTNETLILPSGLMHRDFTQPFDTDLAAATAALVDEDGHGTHVAGIIAGQTNPDPLSRKIVVDEDTLQKDGTVATAAKDHTDAIMGVAPRCKLLSLKVLQRGDNGDVSSVLAAIGYIQRLNDYGRDVKVHGLNISLGYGFDPEWFAAGHSPLCTEVDRLVKMGTVVVIAAGNSGLTTVITSSGGSARASQTGTIADPGNAALAITVGSTHRDSPHTYGVSFFSGKGPTSDGRLKPDLVAPGERIVSCKKMDVTQPNIAPFREDSGTSMASPHVSGAVAAFLSVRREFIGQTDRVKEIMLDSAIDLGRRVEFQGRGLVDVMRALQSV